MPARARPVILLCFLEICIVPLPIELAQSHWHVRSISISHIQAIELCSHSHIHIHQTLYWRNRECISRSTEFTGQHPHPHVEKQWAHRITLPGFPYVHQNSTPTLKIPVVALICLCSPVSVRVLRLHLYFPSPFPRIYFSAFPSARPVKSFYHRKSYFF